MRLNTVNVIEMFNGSFKQLIAFPDNEAGNHGAESLFVSILKEHDVPSDDIFSYVEDGIYDNDNGHVVLLVHSEGETNPLTTETQ